VPALNVLARKSVDATTTFADRVHFVHVYNIEAHPQSPDPCPYVGAVAENAYSIVAQPLSLDARVENAARIGRTLSPEQLMLLDDLKTQINPVWCTYGPAPSSGFLIAQDGTIAVAQLWTDIAAMEVAIRRFLDQRGAGADTAVK
jgi:hypothetical protein